MPIIASSLPTAYRAMPAPTGVGGCDAAEAFAQTIMRRYVEWRGGWGHPNLVFVQARPGVTRRSVSYRTEVHLAHRLALTVLAWPEREQAHGASIAPGSLPRPMPRLERRVELHMVVAAPATGAIPIERAIQPLFARQTRVEVAALPANALAALSTSAAPGAPPAAPPSTTAPHTTMRAAQPVVRRSPARELGEGPPTDVLDGPAGSRRQPANSPPIDVSRLTDQIIQTIDRRIIAQRERMGRS